MTARSRPRSVAPAGLLPIDQVLSNAHGLLPYDPAAALDLAHRIIGVAPQTAEAHRIAGRAYRLLGQAGAAEHAELAAISVSIHDSLLQEAAMALAANMLHVAEPILRERLKAVPHDVAAIRMLAELAGRIGRYADAERLLRRAVELAPAFHAARFNLATVLHRLNRTEDALAELDHLSKAEPENLAHANLRAAALGRVGDFEDAIALYESVLEQRSAHPTVWMSYGHVLKTVGRQQDAIVAYRSALAIRPELGEVWWSLANLKTFRFTNSDIRAMEQALVDAEVSDEDRLHLDFALGKAYHDAGASESAFRHYSAGNALRKVQLDYDPSQTSRRVDRSIELCTPSFLAARVGQGCLKPDPIFIVGLPRAGSTLIEQILASHSMVEGTMELPDIPALIAQSGIQDGSLGKLDTDALQRLGEAYLERTQIQRKTDKPFFIDKLPNNWLNIGFIHLVLPNAKIVDARRNPLDCCFSNFRQHFARGQSFTYGLEDLGQYYADYVRLMAHFDAVLPGRIHRVIHERLVNDPESEIRALLKAMDLPFEEQCLTFHENRRAVRTASSEQVRRPINRDGIDQWEPYSAWLDPLREALGPSLGDHL